jgi:hypothetical protein
MYSRSHLSYAHDNLGVKKASAPRKIPRNAPSYVLPQTKKIISRTFKIRGTLVFLCPKERGRERESDRERARTRARKGKGTRETEKTKAWVIIFPNCPAQNENSANYTVLYMEERYSR